MSLLSIAFSLFLLMDSLGNIPLYISFLKRLDPQRQRVVICRELLIALAIIMLFTFVGDGLMQFLNVQNDTIQIAGGIILFLLCLKMIFPPPHDPNESLPHDTEPFIVPLAVPLIAGPAVLAAVMIYAKQENNNWVMMGAILIAWSASLVVLLASSFLKQVLGWRGILALERLMGLILILIAVQMFLSGISSFMARQSVYTEGHARIDSASVGQPLNLRPACTPPQRRCVFEDPGAKLSKFSCFGAGKAWHKFRAPPWRNSTLE